MNNAAGEVGKIPLTVFGGAVTEMAPTDLPEGASPFNQDVDYLPGSVFTRGGRANVIAYSNIFAEDLAGIAVTIPGTHAPSEQPWVSPSSVTTNIPGTYAAAIINAGAQFPGSYLDNVATQTGVGGNASVTGTPLFAPEYAIYFEVQGNATGRNPGAPWNDQGGGGSGPWTQLLNSVNPITASVSTLPGTHQWVNAIVFLGTNGSVPVYNNIGGGSGNGTTNFQFSPTITAGDTIFVVMQSNIESGLFSVQNYTPSDSRGNVYVKICDINSQAAGKGAQLQIWMAQNCPAGVTVITSNPSPGNTTDVAATPTFFRLSNLGPINSSPSYSQILKATNFGFNIPITQSVTGLEVEVFGHQTSLSPDAVLTAQLLNADGSLSPTSIDFQLPLADGLAFGGSPSEGWQVPIQAAQLNNPSFGVQIVAKAPGGGAVNFYAYAVKIKAFLTPNPPQNFDYVKTYEQQNSGVFTLALDAGGILWQEDASNNIGIFSSIYTAINPGSFAKSVTFQNTEYIAFTDLVQGTDMPRQWTGVNLDRVSQVGPAAPPSFATTSNGSSVVSIKQNTPFVLPVWGGDSANNWLLVSAGPAAHGTFGTPATPGNVMTLVLASNVAPPAYFKAGTNIQISGFPSINGKSVNNDPTGVTNPAYYTITSVGAAIPGENSYDWITFQVPFTTFFNSHTPGGCNVQATTATMIMGGQVPYLEVGNQFTLAGVSPAGWNNTFTVLQTPNAAALQISSTSLTGNVAQYVFTLISGSAPQVGQFVNVNGTLNGNGIFNVINAVITSVSPNSFSVSIQSPNISAAAEANANGSIYGTIFIFDPAGTVTNPIIGNAGAAGGLQTTGVIGIGVRKAVVIFKTRNAALTQPSPFAQFNITSTATAIASSAIPIGPPDTVARIIAFTGAGGDNYFWIPQPVTVISNGQPVTYSATIINDNVTTQATFSFPDAVLIRATAIDIQGNNLFAQQELGSCRGFLTYADRLIAWGVQNKVQNLLNLSFDGGIGVQNLQQLATQPAVPTYPLGWTVDSVNGGGGQVLVSPLFGNSYYAKNATGNLQAFYGMITQPGYVNQLGTPIFTTATQYSVRLAARCPSGAVSGSLVCDLFSATLNQVFGSFAVPLATMTSNFKIFTGSMLAAPFQSVPKDLVFRVYLSNVPNLGDVEIDRVEPFPTLQPSFSTQFFASYAFNQEAFDGVTGLFGPAQNQQRVNGGMVIFDTLYMLKEKSWYSTSDNGVTEPFKWNWREVSSKVGTIGIHSYDYGEGWAVTACRAGVYFFEGGEPIKISQEIQSVWDLINWKAGASIWVRNDPTTKTIKIGVPITTPNKFMPEFPAAVNPTSPNVVLSMSYRELNTGAALASTGPIKSTYSGRLMTPEPSRKWSFWNIRCPYADLIDRGNNSDALLYCTGYTDSKIFQLLETQLSDDGIAINSFYMTCGLPTPEQAAQHGVDVLRSTFDYITANVSGAGTLNTMLYPEDPQNQPPVMLDAIPLDAIAQGNSEITVNWAGNRHFLRMGTNAVGAKFSLSEIVSIMSPDPWAPVRGTARGSL